MIPKVLNGRTRPTKKSTIEARFDQGDELIPTGIWSDDYKWVEVYGGESGTVWVHTDYVSETTSSVIYMNESYKQVKIRSKPIAGKVRKYLKKGKDITITQIILGWGKCSKGWIDLEYLEESE